MCRPLLKLVTLGVLLSIGSISATPQSGSQPGAGASSASTVAEASARMQAQDFAAAARLLEDVIAREPKNARAWRLLGAASQKAKNVDRAIAAYVKALEIEPDAPTVPTTFYNLACAHALKHDADGAFAWLARARATHKLDMTQMDSDADLASLRGDPRFRPLLPTAADFADPIVEPVTILREWDGEAAGDQFGWIARNIGDVDGDRVPDVVTSAPTKAVGGANAGRIYVYSTASGRLLWSANGHPGDQLGSGIEGAGDTNHDGVPDVIASAPGAGYVKVYSGKDGRVLLTLNAENKNEDAFGRHVSKAGDVNRDGYADVVVGAPGSNAGGKGAGRAYVYSGKDGRLLLTLTGEHAGDAFGSTVAGFADAKRLLLIVGAPGAGPRKTGRVSVYDGLISTPKFTIESDDTGNSLGAMFVAVSGDVDGDGVPDVYASDWSNRAKGPSTGRVYVHSGANGRRLFTFTGENAGDGFGTSPSTAGDVNHDGHADFIVGAWQFGGVVVSGGRAYLYSGKDGTLMKTFTCRTPGDTFGFDAVTMGDVDGDGTADFLITSGWSGVHGFHSGRVFIISSGVHAK
jgi:hypothetical protein